MVRVDDERREGSILLVFERKRRLRARMVLESRREG
jgi:hypothetical protein